MVRIDIMQAVAARPGASLVDFGVSK